MTVQTKNFLYFPGLSQITYNKTVNTLYYAHTYFRNTIKHEITTIQIFETGLESFYSDSSFLTGLKRGQKKKIYKSTVNEILQSRFLKIYTAHCCWKTSICYYLSNIRRFYSYMPSNEAHALSFIILKSSKSAYLCYISSGLVGYLSFISVFRSQRRRATLTQRGDRPRKLKPSMLVDQILPQCNLRFLFFKFYKLSFGLNAVMYRLIPQWEFVKNHLWKNLLQEDLYRFKDVNLEQFDTRVSKSPHLTVGARLLYLAFHKNHYINDFFFARLRFRTTRLNSKKLNNFNLPTIETVNVLTN